MTMLMMVTTMMKSHLWAEAVKGRVSDASWLSLLPLCVSLYSCVCVIYMVRHLCTYCISTKSGFPSPCAVVCTGTYWCLLKKLFPELLPRWLKKGKKWPKRGCLRTVGRVGFNNLLAGQFCQSNVQLCISRSDIFTENRGGRNCNDDGNGNWASSIQDTLCFCFFSWTPPSFKCFSMNYSAFYC